MRRLLMASAISGSLLFGGCATTGGIDPNQIAQIQEYTRLACSFVPTASTVAQIIAAMVGGQAAVATAAQAAEAICAAVTSKSARRGHPPMAYGVRIRGEFVRR